MRITAKLEDAAPTLEHSELAAVPEVPSVCEHLRRTSDLTNDVPVSVWMMWFPPAVGVGPDGEEHSRCLKTPRWLCAEDLQLGKRDESFLWQGLKRSMRPSDVGQDDRSVWFQQPSGAREQHTLQVLAA